MSPSVGQNLAPTLENTMMDEQKAELAKAILRMHFGVRGVDGSPCCAECGNLDVPWPCAPARLAEAVQAEELAK